MKHPNIDSDNPWFKDFFQINCPDILKIIFLHVCIMLTQYPGDGFTFPSTVTYHLQGGQLDLEFNSSGAQLVNLVVSLAQLVSLSVAFPAKLR